MVRKTEKVLRRQDPSQPAAPWLGPAGNSIWAGGRPWRLSGGCPSPVRPIHTSRGTAHHLSGKDWVEAALKAGMCVSFRNVSHINSLEVCGCAYSSSLTPTAVHNLCLYSDQVTSALKTVVFLFPPLKQWNPMLKTV